MVALYSTIKMMHGPINIRFTQLLPFRTTDTNAEFIWNVAQLYEVYRAWTVCTFTTRRLIHESICYTLREEELKQTKGGGILSGKKFWKLYTLYVIRCVRFGACDGRELQKYGCLWCDVKCQHSGGSRCPHVQRTHIRECPNTTQIPFTCSPARQYFVRQNVKITL